MPVKAFFAYPSRPTSISDAITHAAKDISDGGQVTVSTWEEASVGGKVIIDEICRQIEAAQIFCADLTGINPNVMFELGFAIARNKRIWLTLDPSHHNAKQGFEKLRMLTTVGYASCSNSQHILRNFYRDRPFDDINSTIFQQSILPNLTASARDRLLYLKSRHENEASVRVSLRLDQSKLKPIVDDPNESPIQALVWYATHAHSAAGVLCHFTSSNRDGALVYNARAAFVAGLAHGFGKKLLLLAEADEFSPLDYRDIVKLYANSAGALRHTEDFLSPIEKAHSDNVAQKHATLRNLALANELQRLQVGEYIAENEQGGIDEYFLETASYLEAVHGRTSIFVGRKGVGKTATLFKLERELSADKRNLVVVVKPVAYEIQGVIRLLASYRDKDSKGFAIESLWKFLLYTEMANSAVRDLEARGLGNATDEGRDLLYFIRRKHPFLSEPFSVRLERCIEQLFGSQEKQGDQSSVGAVRLAISESLHKNILSELQGLLSRCLANRQRVALLIDNLDKAWDKEHDVAVLADVILGLLSTCQRICDDFLPRGPRLPGINVSLSLFLRSDIFFRVLPAAREPDKISYHRILWNDRELLLRVIEDRIVAGNDGELSVDKIWSHFIVPTVGGVPTRDHILNRIMPRPRDLILFFTAALSTAINRRHLQITEADIRDAEEKYSQFALESMIVESALDVVSLRDVAYEFLGTTQVLTRAQLVIHLSNVKVEQALIQNVIDALCTLGFLAVETTAGEFRFSADAFEYKKNGALAGKYAEASSQRRYLIHPALCAELAIPHGLRYTGRVVL